MSGIPINTLLAEFTPYEAAELLLGETGLTDIPRTLLAGTFGLALQALVTGSVLQLVHRYFIRQKRSQLRTGVQDPPLARVGVVWLTALICLHVVVVNVINTRVVLMSRQFTAGYLMDFWLAQISNLIFAIVLLPVFLFFAFRAWNLWSRSKAVLALCLAAVLPAVCLGVTAAALGLQHPYPLQEIDNSAFAAWLPFFTTTMKKLQWVALASSIAQFAAACIFSGLICAGLWHHRACCAIMPGFTGKIAFACGESLFPLVVTSGAILAGDVLTKSSTYSVGPLISRAVHSCAPAIYFHCLMNSLTSAQRQRDALRTAAAHASSEEANTGLSTTKEKADPYAEDDEGSDTFNPRYHPEDLDTPLQVEITHPGAGAGKNGLPKIVTTSCSSTTAGPPIPSSGSGGFMSKRPTFGIRSPFSFTRKNSLPSDPESELRSAGTGRRSSLAFAAQPPPSPGSLSIKLQNKLPMVSYQPKVDRRQSESIFVAHEEFEGLPTTPGDVDVGGMRLGDIDEGASDAALTPKYFTPPRVPSPMPSPAGLPTQEQMEWREGEEAKSPESVYEAEVGKA